jgi:hypothetical protein
MGVVAVAATHTTLIHFTLQKGTIYIDLVFNLAICMIKALLKSL